MKWTIYLFGTEVVILIIHLWVVREYAWPMMIHILLVLGPAYPRKNDNWDYVVTLLCAQVVTGAIIIALCRSHMLRMRHKQDNEASVID